MTAPSGLISLIVEEIGSQGPMTLARYMELALYHPEFGYYRTRDPFGVSGDFYTAEQLQPVFGELVASYVEQLTVHSGSPHPFGVLELGAGRSEMRETLHRWNYRAFDWRYPELPQQWNGLVFANEFFDALPVHLLRRSAAGWQELYVVMRSGDLALAPGAPSNPALLDYAGQYGAALPPGGRLEVCLALSEWVRRIASLLAEGHILIIDYGYDSRELQRLPEGTLLSYRRHHAHQDFFMQPGSSDITAHVSFSWLTACFQEHGFVCQRNESLAQWVLSVWPEQELQRKWKEADRRWQLQWKQLVFGLGETFRVLELSRPSALDRSAQ